MPPELDDGRGPPTGWGIPAGVATGAAIGLLFGIMLEQIALGLTIGAGIGLLAGASLTAVAATPADRRPTVVAVAIALLTAGTVAIVTVLLR